MRASRAILTLGLLAALACTAQAKQDRRTWVYEGGWFSTHDGKHWMEFSDSIFREQGRPWTFDETQRSDQYVELYDASRSMTIRLWESKTQWKVKGQEQWNPLYKGRWKEPIAPPNPQRPDARGPASSLDAPIITAPSVHQAAGGPSTLI